MIKVKDGYAKLIGTTYQGSATQVLLSNGGDLEYSASSKASTLVQRNASQHIYATYFNSAISDEALTDIGSVYVRNTSDTFIRRVSKTQFYSILDDKFVTLDTTQSITGAKTFSTSVRFANNASIIQNQNDTSNYTTILKWYKNGASRNTYDPSIGQHNTGGDGNGSICILPYPTETRPQGGTVGLFISKGVLKLDGKSVALAENYYTKTESDERYVNVTGDTMTGPLIVKATVTGTQLISTIATGTSPLKVTSTTVVTNLNSDLFDGFHETAFVRSFWTSSPGYDCSKYNSRPLISFTYSNNAPFTGGFIDVVTNGYGFYLGTSYTSNAPLYYKRHGISSNGGMGTWQQLARITDNVASATKLQTARTINGTLFDGTANITTAYWGTARTITLSGAVTGSASVNGSQNVTITTTYQTGSIDGRYVGGNKTANHGSSGTAYTADSYSSTFARKEFVAFAERGSWAYANNGYVTTDTGVNIPLAGTAVFQWGASDTNKTQLFITPHDNSGVSNPAANEMLFYTSNGSGHTSAWTRVLTHRNYTNYTVTKTGGGASGTWEISITGNAATARTAQYLASDSRMDYGWNGLNYFNINGTAGTAVKANNTPTTAWWHILRFNHANSSGYYTDLAVPFNDSSLYYKRVTAGALADRKWVRILDELNYSSPLDGRYVTLATNQTVSGIKTFSTQQKFTVATGTSPFTVSSTTVVSNLNADMLDGWHLNYILKDGYVTSATSGLSSYWRKVWDITLNNQYNDVDINLLVHSAHGQQWGIISFKVRQNGTGTAKNISAFLAEVVGNIPLDRFRLYYNNSSGLCQLWCNPNGQYCVYNYRVLAKTWRTGTEAATLGTFYTGNTSTAQSLPSDSYVSMTGITIVNTAAKVANALTFSAGKFSSKTYDGSSAITVNVPTHTSHLTNNSGFWTGTRYWANIAVSTSSSTSTSPTFSTAYTSNWFRSTGSTGWYSQTYGGGWYMSDSTWIRTFGSKSVYQDTGQIRTDGYLVTNRGLTAGATSPNNETYKLHVTGASWSSGLIRAGGGFYHNSVNSNSYVLLAGGSYKGLGDFAKGNAGSATKGVYVTGGTVIAMTYSLSSNLDSGISGKLAYYSSNTTVAAHSSSVGSFAQPIYLNAGSLSACSYSFTGTYLNPVIIWCGEIYRTTPGSTYWYSKKNGGCCSISFTTKNAGLNGNLMINIPHGEPFAAFCSTVKIFDSSTAISAEGNTITGRSAGMGDYMTICEVRGTTGQVYIRKFSQQNKDNDTWRNGELGTTTTSNGNKPVARFYLMIVGRYI